GHLIISHFEFVCDLVIVIWCFAVGIFCSVRKDAFCAAYSIRRVIHFHPKTPEPAVLRPGRSARPQPRPKPAARRSSFPRLAPPGPARQSRVAPKARNSTGRRAAAAAPPAPAGPDSPNVGKLRSRRHFSLVKPANQVTLRCEMMAPSPFGRGMG